MSERRGFVTYCDLLARDKQRLFPPTVTPARPHPVAPIPGVTEFVLCRGQAGAASSDGATQPEGFPTVTGGGVGA